MNTENKITVIYHSADFDGIFCREIARKFLGESATYIGWDYGDAKLPFPTEGTVYVLDLSPECFELLPDINEVGRRLVWIDHHKTAIDKWPDVLLGYRIDGVSACRLAWQWFTNTLAVEVFSDPAYLPKKEDYVCRSVSEPLAVRLAGEYDIWDKRDDRVDTFQLGLRSVAPESLSWARLLSSDWVTAQLYIDGLLSNGRLLQDYVNQRDAAIVGAVGFIVEFEGLKFLALNSATKGSLQFAAKDVPETGHEALLKFNYTGALWDVSLYHAKHRTDLDLSAIAAKHGGGGHRGACGFRAKTLPFLQS